jgi:hypothetical protein
MMAIVMRHQESAFLIHDWEGEERMRERRE